MSTQQDRFDLGQILQPAYPSNLNRLAAVGVGNSLTVARGQAMARKTSDAKFYPLNLAATDGTQIFAGFSQYAFASDSNGLVYLVTSGSAQNTYFSSPVSHADIYTGGIFDPNDLITAATGTVTAEVDTITPGGTITTGDVYSVVSPSTGEEATFIVGATATAAAVVTGLKAAWNSNPVLAGIATPSGSGTLILTAVTAGQAMGLKAGVSGVGTVGLVITTAAVDAQQAEVDTFTPSSPTTGDVYTMTITYPGAQTVTVSATVGSTQTAAAIVALLTAAWNANPKAAAYATPSGTNTLILTGTAAGSALNITASVVGTGTMAKVVTTPAWGRNISDILAGCPGARILQPSGYWELP